jgi:Fe-S-cluster containining protein
MSEKVLPCEECGGRCCYHVLMTMGEFKKIRKKYGVPKGATLTEGQILGGVIPGMPAGPGMMVSTPEGVCAYLKNGRCSVYDLRPRVCRLYGHVPEMPCEYIDPGGARRVAEGHGLRDALLTIQELVRRR